MVGNGDDGIETLTIGNKSENAIHVLRGVVQRFNGDDEIIEFNLEVKSKSEINHPDFIKNLIEEGESSGENEVIKFNKGSNSFLLTALFFENDLDWLSSGYIKRELIEETSIPQSRLSQILWDISERGILEKKDCPDDGRMKEYKISELGERSYRAAVE